MTSTRESRTAPPVRAVGDPPAAPSVAARTRQVLRAAVVRYWSLIALIAAWWLWSWGSGFNQIVVPGPVAVAGDLVTAPGAYLPDLAVTAAMAVGGLVAGMLLGSGLAVAVWVSPLVSGMVTPAALLMRSVPVVAMIPILARLFGYGLPTVMAITTVVSFFPAFVFVGARLRDPPRQTSEVLRALGASRAAVLRHLLLPHAVPGVLVALRLTAPTAVLAAMLAEYLMGERGLGHLFATSVSFYQVDRAWGAAVVASALSVACFVGARAVEQRGLARFT